MSSRGQQTHSSRPRRPLEKRVPRQSDPSLAESGKAEGESPYGRNKSRDDSRRRENSSRSRTSRSPRKGRDKDPSTLEKSSSSRNLSSRKDETKNKDLNEKGRDSAKSPTNGKMQHKHRIIIMIYCIDCKLGINDFSVSKGAWL